MWNVWDTTNGRRLIVHRDPPYNVDYRQVSPDQANFLRVIAISPNGTRLVTLSDQGSVQVRDLLTGKTFFTFKNSSGHSDRGNIAWSLDNTHVVLCWEDPRVLVWDATTGQHTTTYTLGDLQIRKAAWSPDNRYLAGEAWVSSVHSITSHGIVRIWDAMTSKNIATYPFDGEMPRGAWSPGSRCIALPNIYVVNVWQLA
jgi:WD40 repeat protein